MVWFRVLGSGKKQACILGKNKIWFFFFFFPNSCNFLLKYFIDQKKESHVWLLHPTYLNSTHHGIGHLHNNEVCHYSNLQLSNSNLQLSNLQVWWVTKAFYHYVNVTNKSCKLFYLVRISIFFLIFLNFASKECLITPKSLQTLLMNPTLNGLFFSFSFFNIREWNCGFKSTRYVNDILIIVNILTCIIKKSLGWQWRLLGEKCNILGSGWARGCWMWPSHTAEVERVFEHFITPKRCSRCGCRHRSHLWFVRSKLS